MPPLPRRRRDAAPLVWRLFGREWLSLTSRQTDRWWRALRRATSTRAVELRSAVLCQAALPQTRARLEHLARHPLSPQALVETLEDLVSEARLSRQESSALQEAVLRKTGPHGRWKGEPGDHAAV